MTTRDPIPWTDLLDPRPTDLAQLVPIPHAANIPADQLSTRTAELPPPGAALRVLDIRPYAADAVAELTARQRPARLVAAAAPRGADPIDLRPHRLWQPAPALFEFLNAYELPASAAVLDLGCGVGRDAVYLAALGCRVTAVDLLPDALERLRVLQQRYAPDTVPILAVQADLDQALLRFQPHHDLIILMRFWSPAVVSHLAKWLRVPGNVLAESFSRADQQRTGSPPARRLPPDPATDPPPPGLTLIHMETTTVCDREFQRVHWRTATD